MLRLLFPVLYQHSQALLKLELKEAKKKAKQLYNLVSDREYLLCFGTGFI